MRPGTITATRTAAACAALLVLVPAAFALRAAAGPVSAARHHRHGERAFVISGRLTRPLRPGASQRLDLRLSNRRRFVLWVTRLKVRVTVDRRHSAAGCSARRDFAVRQLARRAYPLRLPRHRARRLSRLRVRALPRVAMRDRAVNQDACKGARLTLRYSGTARRTRPRR